MSNCKRINVSIKEWIVEEVDLLVGKKTKTVSRSDFFAQAAEEKVKRETKRLRRAKRTTTN